MGDFRVRKIKDIQDRRLMYQYMLDDIEAFESMLHENIFETGPLHIGAEQELCIVDKNSEPTSSALQLLSAVDDEHYTNELALFNLEINLDPLPLKGNCFSKMETDLLRLLQKGHQVAGEIDQHLLMTGILPTLRRRHLKFDYMTPIKRYKTLSQTLSEIRGSKFEIYLQGADELIMSLGSVLFEACNTSFQLHLQVTANDFVNQHNWSQMIAGPVLAACVNAPMLFENELWAETRIALFKQSLDTRSSERFIRKKLPRVYFGRNWLQKSAAELWKNDVTRFPLLLTSDDFQTSTALLKAGKIPDLRAIRLHNGTTYTWNRLCYGYSKEKPHLRIECRYLPAGPTAIDEIANFAFWIGLMKAEPKGGVEFWKKQDFKIVKDNFIKAARTGLNTIFNWYGEHIPAKRLILEKLIPLAYEGLKKQNVAAEEAQKYLTIIEKRVRAEITGSAWIVQNFRTLEKRHGGDLASKIIVQQSLAYQKENRPIHLWENTTGKKYLPPTKQRTVEQLMTREIFSVEKNSSIELAQSILQWNDFHHLPVENQKGDLIGLITDGMIQRWNSEENKTHFFVEDIMLQNPHTIQAHDTINTAQAIMEKCALSALPVVYGKKLVGMLTVNDLNKGVN